MAIALMAAGAILALTGKAPLYVGTILFIIGGALCVVSDTKDKAPRPEIQSVRKTDSTDDRAS